jgi:hypothetical protein
MRDEDVIIIRPAQVGLEYEVEVVWLKRIRDIIGVSELILKCKNRNKPPKIKGLVGFTVLDPKTPNCGEPHTYIRRAFVETEGGPSPNVVLCGVTLKESEKYYLTRANKVV